MKIMVADLEYLLGRKELEEFKPKNGLEKYYRRSIMGPPYIGATETFNIVTNSLRGLTSILSIGNLENDLVEIKLINEVLLPNGSMLENVVFRYVSKINDINRAKYIFEKMHLVHIIEEGSATQQEIDDILKFINDPNN